MADRIIEVLNRTGFEELFISEQVFQQYAIPADWLLWELSHLASMYYVTERPDINITLIQDGCKAPNGDTNCTEVCGNATLMFQSAENLWNCMSLSTAALVAKKAKETESETMGIDSKSEDDANRVFNFGSLDDFSHVPISNYMACSLRSCLDSRFGECPEEIMDFLKNYQMGSEMYGQVRTWGQIMSRNYCEVAEPGIDFDIAGPGIVVGYMIQFGLVFFFALSYKLITSWLEYVTWVVSLPFSDRESVRKRVQNLQKHISQGPFAEAISSSVVDLQETQALFLVIIAGVTITTFTGNSGVGLKNIQTMSSWLTNSIILKGMVTAGSYPLLLIQIILHRRNRRWWYTLLFVTVNSVLVIIIEASRRLKGESLLKRFRESAALSHCGDNLGPRTFCLRYTSPSTAPDHRTGLVTNTVNPQDYFKFNSRNQQPVYILTIFLILDWLIDLTYRRHAEKQQYTKLTLQHGSSRPRTLQKIFTKRVVVITVQLFWILAETLAFFMCILGLIEFISFLYVLKGDASEGRSAINLTEWPFGQLVAVAAWLPVASKFISLLIDRKGLEKRLDTGYLILKRPTEKSQEKMSYQQSDVSLLPSPDNGRAISTDTELGPITRSGGANT